MAQLGQWTGRTAIARPAVATVLVLALAASTLLRPGVVAGQVAQSPLIAPAPGCSANCGGRCGRGAAALPSFSASTLTDDSLFVQSGFVSPAWEGYVTAYDAKAYLGFLGGRNVEPAPAWTANFPVPSDRNVFTSSSPSAPVAFDWCSLGPDQRALLDPVYANAHTCPVAPPPVFAWLRGDAAHERRNGGAYRDRPSTILGDVVNSTPLYSRSRDHAYQQAPAASHSASGLHGHEEYRRYVQAKASIRPPVVMFGANDGMFHVLDARVGLASSGREIFAYVPRAAYAALATLSDPAYKHRYSVDGPVIEGDVWNGTSWKTIAIGTAGAGAAGIFAIDVTAPGPSMGASSVLWDITAADHPSAVVRNALGLAIGPGVIGSVRFDADGTGATEPNGAWAYIVGNGYESRSDTAVLLVFDALDGSLIRAIDTGVGAAGNRNGLGAVTPVYDGNRNIVAVYAGDKLGHLWKFDLGSARPSDWKVFNEQPTGVPGPLFTATEGGMTRPIHQAPRVAPHPLGGLYVAFGTGKYFEVGDPANSDDQGIFVLRDQGRAAPIPFGDVELVRTEEYTDGTDHFRRLHRPDLANFDWTDKGFWVRLRPLSVSSSKERVIGPLFLDGGMLVVSTFSPEGAAGPCAPAGRSHLYRIDLAGGFTRGAFGAEAAVTIGRRFEPGTTGGFAPLYQPADTGPVRAHSVSTSDLEAMLANPRYRVAGDGAPVRQGAAGTCMHAGLRIDGSVARVETNCAGLMPLRSWRPMK
jgi:type IV pilus assembly protein PilY1